MKSGKIFCRQKFNELFVSGTIGMAMEYIMLLTDTLIASYIIGERGVSGIQLVLPLFSFTAFIASLIGMGASYCFSKEMGRMNKLEASRYFGMSVTLALTVGAVMMLLVFFGQEDYIAFFAPSAEVLSEAAGYYTYMPGVMLVYPIYVVMLAFVMADGDAVLTISSYVMQIFGNIVLSVYLCQEIGIAGISLGTFVGSSLAVVILGLHFFRRGNALHYVFFCSREHFKKAVHYSIVDASLLLCWAVSSVVINRYMIITFGDRYLPVLAVACSAMELTLVFDGIGEAFAGIFNVYYGEKNTSSIKKLMRYVVKVALYEGIATTIIVFVLAGQLPVWFGIRDAELIEKAAVAIRMASIGFTFSSLIFVWTSYYLLVGKINLSLMMVVLGNVFVFLGLFILGGNYLGFNGMWLSVMLSSFFTYVLTWYGIKVYYKKAGSDFGIFMPWLLDHIENRNESFDIVLNGENEAILRKKLEGVMLTGEVRLSVCEAVIKAAGIIAAKTMENNPGKSVLSEWSLFMNDTLKLYIRDDGIINDITTAVNGKLPPGTAIHYLTTMGANRLLLTFENIGEIRRDAGEVLPMGDI